MNDVNLSSSKWNCKSLCTGPNLHPATPTQNQKDCIIIKYSLLQSHFGSLSYYSNFYRLCVLYVIIHFLILLNKLTQKDFKLDI